MRNNKNAIYENGNLFTRGWVLNKVFNTEEFEKDTIYKVCLYKIGNLRMGIDLIWHTYLGKSSKKCEKIGFRINH